MSLGGHIFVRDGIRLDYCVAEAVNSLLPICDDVVVMDCGSSDGTPDLLRREFGSNPKVRLFFDGPWDQYKGQHGERLRLLGEDGRKLLTTDWQFMLQADEVLHERSYDPIRHAMQSGRSDRYYCRRVDLWGDVNRCVFLDINRYPQSRRPMDPDLVRLAKVSVPVVSDAGTLDKDGANGDYFELITIYHYSMVRDPVVLPVKCVEMHAWYHGQPPEMREDDVMVRWMRQGQPFDHTIWKTNEELQPIPYSHPVAAAPWVARHPAP